MIGPNKPKWTWSFVTNVISLCTCWRLRFMYYSVLYQWPISELSRQHPALDCVSHSDLTYTYIQRDIFTWTEIYWKDYYWLQIYSCNTFHYQILNDNTFLKKEILLKTMMAVHRFGIRSSDWCWAKIFDLDQAAFRSGSEIWLSVLLFVYVWVLSNRNDLWHLRPA